MKLHQSITLADGRRLSYADIGHPDHPAIFYFHGFPGSRLEAAFAQQTILNSKVRLIAVERPGYGQSTHDPRRQITDWPGDIAQLADALGMETFSLLGVSAGGVYALACAQALGDRVHRTGIAGTLAPVHDTNTLRHMSLASQVAFRLMNRDSRRARWIVGRLLGKLIRHYPAQVVRGIKLSLCRRDRMALNDENFSREFTRSIGEAYAQGYHGPYHDLSLVTKAWGFDPEQIRRPVYLWHGQQDSIVPHEMGHYLSERLPHCHSLYPTEEGHFSIITNYMEQALHTLSVEQQGTHPGGATLRPQIKRQEMDQEAIA